MLTVDVVKAYYEYFYNKKYSNSKYVYPSLSREVTLIENFLIRLNKLYNINCLGSDFLWKYFVFQFSYWDNLELKQVSKIQPNFIIGSQAIERYDKRDAEYDWQLSLSRLEKKYKLSQTALEKKFEKKPQRKKISHTDQTFRAKFLNTDKGLGICIEYTSLFDNRDASCLVCRFRKECKELLKANYPILYSERGYGK